MNKLIFWHLCAGSRSTHPEKDIDVPRGQKRLKNFFSVCAQWSTLIGINLCHLGTLDAVFIIHWWHNPGFCPRRQFMCQTWTICQKIRCLGTAQEATLSGGWRNLAPLQTGNGQPFWVKGDHHCCSNQCHMLSSFLKALSEVMSLPIQLLPFLGWTRGCCSAIIQLRFSCVVCLIFTASCLIWQNCKNSDPPSHSCWIKDVLHFYELRKYTF